VTLGLVLLVCGWGVGSGQLHVKGRAVVDKQDTSLDTRVSYILTEARVILPGAQALLGFQFAIVLTQGFAQLSNDQRIVHGIAIACVVLATALLMAPAAQHRLRYAGQNSAEFYRSADRCLLTASVFLAVGIAADVHVVAIKITDSRGVALSIAAASALALFGLWHIWPLLARARQRSK
jgi:hypothetical protein